MKSWKTWLGVALSVLFLWLAIGNIDWHAFGASLKTIDLPLFFAAMLVMVGTLILRGVRWHFLLKPVRTVSPITLFWSTTIGFAVNNVLPARLGEVARAYSAQRQGRVPFGAAFGTIVVERLYDTFSALFLFVLMLLAFDFGNLESVFHVSSGRVAATLGVGGAGLLAAIVILKWRTEWAIRIFRFFAKPLPARWTDKLEALFRSFVSGLTQSKKPADVAIILLISVLIWVISAIQVRMCVLTFGVALNLQQTVILLMAIVFAVAIPAAPGYVGVYHFLAKQALIHYAGMDPALALSAAVVIHAANYIAQTALGLTRFAYEGMSFTSLAEAGKEATRPVTG